VSKDARFQKTNPSTSSPQLPLPTHPQKFVVDVPARLRAILNRLSLEGHIVREVEPKFKRGEAERLVGLIHDFEYIKSLKDACDKCLETGKPRRLRQSYSRTLVDENSYEAAMDAVGLWLHATDRVLRGGGKVSWASDQVKVYERFTQQPTPPPHPH
jgi:acetoin utilization deacetylase AcuC-like enzyme